MKKSYGISIGFRFMKYVLTVHINNLTLIYKLAKNIYFYKK
jgi:hypothetical protein